MQENSYTSIDTLCLRGRLYLELYVYVYLKEIKQNLGSLFRSVIVSIFMLLQQGTHFFKYNTTFFSKRPCGGVNFNLPGVKECQFKV
jgi:hypothetical protein